MPELMQYNHVQSCSTVHSPHHWREMRGFPHTTRSTLSVPALGAFSFLNCSLYLKWWSMTLLQFLRKSSQAYTEQQAPKHTRQDKSRANPETIVTQCDEVQSINKQVEMNHTHQAFVPAKMGYTQWRNRTLSSFTGHHT